jgi:hypothetical protein
MNQLSRFAGAKSGFVDSDGFEPVLSTPMPTTDFLGPSVNAERDFFGHDCFSSV